MVQQRKQITSTTNSLNDQSTVKTSLLPIRTKGTNEDEHGHVYKYTIDTLARISFFIPVGAIIELGVSGMSLEQTLKARAIGVLMSMATGRPYGIFRDYAFRLLRTDEHSGPFKKGITDTAAFVAFQVPLYAVNLIASGASKKSMLIALGVSTAISGVIGRPCGAWIDFVRTKAGLKASYQIGKIRP